MKNMKKRKSWNLHKEMFKLKFVNILLSNITKNSAICLEYWKILRDRRSFFYSYQLITKIYLFFHIGLYLAFKIIMNQFNDQNLHKKDLEIWQLKKNI